MSDTGSQRSGSPATSEEHDLPDPPAQWDIDAQLPRLERESLNVTHEHLILALDHVGKLLSAKGIPWAVMGGLALFMLGNKNRSTRDVDVAIEAKPRAAIEALRDRRVYTPPLLSMAGSGCGRFYVLTGPEYGVKVDRQIVEVDLIIAGHLGAPRTLSGTTATRTAHTAAGERTYNVLSAAQLCRAKLHALEQREAERDFNDLEWLCMNYYNEIFEVADTLDKMERVNFVEKYRERYPGKQDVVKALKEALKIREA
ncbi:uncharacterized protein B0T15DRAFT_524225 [Chaetomium strumarium]|uniref:Uncharacterized protein n=1 Tax=Chaetomium strumarium TaxID=1170767 RepID=A0AAJ0GYB0_9PEZI|nr:hypothetical protein B0T15DRAFT_524225 [Chaetomium strumarium]